MLICVTCRSADFDETEDGFYVCQLCGTQSQDVIREVEDEELNFNTAGQGKITGARRLRTPKCGADGAEWDGTYGTSSVGSGKGRESRREANTDGGRNLDLGPSTSQSISQTSLDRLIAYCDGVQRLLRKQCDTLVDDFHFTPEIKITARDIWVKFLDNSQLLNADFTDERTFRIYKKFNGADGNDDDDSRDSEDDASDSDGSDSTSEDNTSDSSATDFSGQRQRKRQKQLLLSQKKQTQKKKAHKNQLTFRAWVVNKIPPRITIAICYLACLVHRAPVHLGDFVTWCLDGRFPWLAESVVCADYVAGIEPGVGVISQSGDAGENNIKRRFGAALATALVQKTVPKVHLLEGTTGKVVHFIVMKEGLIGKKSGLNDSGPIKIPPLNASAFLDRWCREFGFQGTQENSFTSSFRRRLFRALALYQAPGYRKAHGASKLGEDRYGDDDDTETGSHTKTLNNVYAPSHAHSLALFIATMKVTFGLEESCAWDWESWCARVDGGGISTRISTTPANPSATDAFLSYCRDHVLAGRKVDPPRDRVVGNLWKAYETREKGKDDVTPITDTHTTADDASPPSTSHQYWLGPVEFNASPLPYRAVIRAVSRKAFVSLHVLHACVRECDLAFEARERGLVTDRVVLKKVKAEERSLERVRLGKKKPPGRPKKEK